MIKEERLQKIVANAGVASRRECEKLILQGRVAVDGKVTKILGTKCLPGVHEISVDGKVIQAPQKWYFLLNKPRGVICSMVDKEKKRKVSDFLPTKLRRIVKPVGRLDVQSSGLIFLSNDGDFSERVSHPGYRVIKLYRVSVKGRMDDDAIAKLEEGIMLEDGLAKAEWVKVQNRKLDTSLIVIAMLEGRNRIVRRMVEAAGYLVKRLSRVQIGPVKTSGLTSGQIRPLLTKEVNFFLGLEKKRTAKAPRKAVRPRKKKSAKRKPV